MTMTVKKKSQRARNVDEKVIGEVLSVLDGWTGKLTWEGLIDTLAARTRQRYTRQALSAHERIQQAFSFRKKALSNNPSIRDEDALKPEQQMIARLEAQVQRLEAENSTLLERFAVWAYNARTRGLDERFLSQRLPQVRRQQTKATS